MPTRDWKGPRKWGKSKGREYELYSDRPRRLSQLLSHSMVCSINMQINVPILRQHDIAMARR